MARRILAGRGPTGKLRNFKAMSNSKLRGVYADLYREKNDREAYDVVEVELASRNLPLTYKYPFES